MQRLVAWHQAHVDVAPEVSAAWLHHRFTQIHPFQDGNGRVARALASLVFLRAGVFPLVVRKSDVQYIDRLEQADAGDLGPLIAFFGQRQKESILAALAADYETQRTQQIGEIISSAIGVLAGAAKKHERDLERVFETADHLIGVARAELQEVSRQIDAQLARVRPADQTWNSNCRVSDDGTSGWYYEQITDAARELDYWANFEPYRSWVRLGIRTHDTFTMVVAVHGHGRVFRGVLVATAVAFRRIADENGNSVVDVRPVQAPFQFNYAEPQAVVERRFRAWLITATTAALEEWRRGIVFTPGGPG